MRASLRRAVLAAIVAACVFSGAVGASAADVKIASFRSIVFFQGWVAKDGGLFERESYHGCAQRLSDTAIILPSCVPWTFSGARIALSMTLIGTVVGEMIASQFGLGRQIAVASGSFDTTGVFAALIVLAVMAMILNALMQRTERYRRRWQGDTNF